MADIEQQARIALNALDMAIASAHGTRVSLHLTRARQLRAALASQVQVPEEWRAFVAACADTRGGMVDGNNLARQARELLAAAPAPEVAP